MEKDVKWYEGLIRLEQLWLGFGQHCNDKGMIKRHRKNIVNFRRKIWAICDKQKED